MFMVPALNTYFSRVHAEVPAATQSRAQEIEVERAALKAERARLRELVKREKRKRQRLLARAAKLSRADLLLLAASTN